VKIAVLVPCYKRPEYTALCLQSLEEAHNTQDITYFLVDDGSQDNTSVVLYNSKLNSIIRVNETNQGLRSVILQFFNDTHEFDIIAKMDNDCTVPNHWLDELVKFLERDLVDIISPNVLPSNAAFKIGKESDVKNLRLAHTVGGLWCMRRSLLNDIQFEDIAGDGIRGAFPVLQQIIIEKDARIGWATNVNVEDIGHYSGQHPKHIKSREHLEYSQDVGRRVAW